MACDPCVPRAVCHTTDSLLLLSFISLRTLNIIKTW